MASHRVLITIPLAVTLAFIGPAAGAQTSEGMSNTQVEVACAMPPLLAQVPDNALVIIGSQDVVPRSVFGNPELLVLKGGTQQGVQLGSEYFVRRLIKTGGGYRDKRPHAVRTGGWVRVVAVNDTTAIATVQHACADINQGDYLESFRAPTVPADITAVNTSAQPDFDSLGRVLYGADERRSGGIGEYMLIDRGTEQGIVAGSHFAIFRDMRVANVPLSAIGEATAITAGPRMTLIRINQARDAVFSGDYVAPRTK